MSRTPVQRKSDKQEKDTAKAFGGKVQKGSGCGWLHRQDVKSGEFLIENKRTDSTNYTIKSKEWEQLRRHAKLEGLVPLMEAQLQGRDLIIIDREDFLDALQGFYKEVPADVRPEAGGSPS